MTAAIARAMVRPGRPAEVDEIRAVILAANGPFEAVLPADFYRSYLASALDVAGRMAAATVLVARQGSRIVGTITAYTDANDEGMPVRLPPGTAGLRATAVHPDKQGHGVGRALVDACSRHARDNGARSLALHTAPFMHAAIALYERCGFQRVPAFDYPATAFFPGEPRDDLVAIAYFLDLR